MHFGYPFCHGENVPDPEYGSGKKCANYVHPARELGPHVAALGMKFYTGRQFPSQYRGRVFIAEHGSWNRTVPIGYRVMSVSLKGNRAVSYDVFAEGWLKGTSAWGRPVDLLVLPDGSLLVSDDRGGARSLHFYFYGQREAYRPARGSFYGGGICRLHGVPGSGDAVIRKGASF